MLKGRTGISPAMLLLVLTLFPPASSAAIIDRIAVIVNEDIVTQSELDAIQRLGLNVTGLPAQKDMLQDRIDHHLVLQQIVRQPPLTLTQDRVQEIVDSFVRRFDGTEEFLVFLHSIGMNYQDFDSELREQLSIQAFITLRFRPFVNVTIEEAERYYNDVFKPEYESDGMEAPPFASSFDQIQQEMVESQVQERARAWLEELRKSANIHVKEFN